MAVGLDEAFWLFEEHGRRALTDDEILFMARAKQKKGCRLIPSTLTAEDKAAVSKLGAKIKKWKREQK